MSRYIDKEIKISDSDITLKDLSYDSGWLELSISESFEKYNSTVHCEYRRVGKIVHVKGVLKPTSEIAAGEKIQMFTLPDGFRPATQVYTVCQGTSKSTWLLDVGSNGIGYFSRYGTTSFTNASISVWLPFDVVFLTD